MLERSDFIPIYLSKNVLTDTCLSDVAISVYVAIRMIQFKNRYEYYITGEAVYCYLMGDLADDLRKIKIFNNAIMELCESGYITILQNKKNNRFKVDVRNLVIENVKESKNYYTIVYQEEIYKIMNSNERYHFKLLRYFLCLTSTFIQDSGGLVSYTPANILRDIADIKNIKTVYRYNEILQDLKIIYVHKSKDYIKEGSEIKTISNVYGRYKDKDFIAGVGDNYSNLYGAKRFSNVQSTRSASHKYMWWLKGKEYSYDELKEVYLTLVEFNKKYERIDNSKIKDLTVFSEYDFYDN